MTVVVVPAASRGLTRAERRESRHAFSFGSYYDPERIGFGLLRAHNEDRIAPGGGYDDHPHADVEIVTWVLAGELEHSGPSGVAPLVSPGVVQVLSAGAGVVHAERNASPTADLHLVQMWIAPASTGGEPSYAQHDVPVGDGWVVAARPPRRPAATLWVARPPAGAVLTVPAGEYVHLFVARGRVRLAGHDLGPGDTAELTGVEADLTIIEPAELLAWSLPSLPSRS